MPVHEPVEKRDVVVFVRTPFCVSEHKGDIYKAVHANRQAREDYLGALKRELEASGDLLEGRRVRAIYVGGGIASVASPDKLSRMLLEFKRRVDKVRGMELTIRFSPRTVGSPSLSAFNVCSYNRASLEVLATRDEFLTYLEAPQNMADITKALGYMDAFGVPNIDCEILYGIPGQTPTSLKNAAVACTGGRGMVHVTLRPYTGPGSEEVSEEDRKAQHAAAAECLAASGCHMYAPECFAKTPFECEYTLADARGLDHIGFGLGARSFVGGMSYRNTSSFEEYVAHSSDFTKVVRDVVEWDEPALAKRMASLRLASNLGLDLGEFKDAHPQQAPKYEPLWDQLCKEGLATLEAGILAPTTEGLRTASRVQQRVWEVK